MNSENYYYVAFALVPLFVSLKIPFRFYSVEDFSIQQFITYFGSIFLMHLLSTFCNFLRSLSNSVKLCCYCSKELELQVNWIFIRLWSECVFMRMIWSLWLLSITHWLSVCYTSQHHSSVVFNLTAVTVSTVSFGLYNTRLTFSKLHFICCKPFKAFHST